MYSIVYSSPQISGRLYLDQKEVRVKESGRIMIFRFSFFPFLMHIMVGQFNNKVHILEHSNFIRKNVILELEA